MSKLLVVADSVPALCKQDGQRSDLEKMMYGLGWENCIVKTRIGGHPLQYVDLSTTALLNTGIACSRRGLVSRSCLRNSSSE